MSRENRSIFDDLKAMLEYYEASGMDRVPFVFHGAALSGKEDLLGKLREELVNARGVNSRVIGRISSLETAALKQGLCLSVKRPGRRRTIRSAVCRRCRRASHKLIEKMGLKRSDVYIANIIKCRPPMNRDPEDDEVSMCRPSLKGRLRSSALR